MSGSGESSAGSNDGNDIEILFQCKRCPGKRFTAAERDTHRQWHVDKNARAQARRGGSPRGMPQAAPSEATTMFTRADDVDNQQPPSTPSKNLRSGKQPTKVRREREKIKPIHNYNPPKNRKKKRGG